MPKFVVCGEITFRLLNKTAIIEADTAEEAAGIFESEPGGYFEDNDLNLGEFEGEVTEEVRTVPEQIAHLEGVLKKLKGLSGGGKRQGALQIANIEAELAGLRALEVVA